MKMNKKGIAVFSTAILLVGCFLWASYSLVAAGPNSPRGLEAINFAAKVAPWLVPSFLGFAFLLAGGVSDERLFAPLQGEVKRREVERETALDIIGKHGYRAHYYFPAVGLLKDRELANALNSLAASGHIITDSTGAIVGKVATTRLTPEELAQDCRAGFRLVKTEG